MTLRRALFEQIHDERAHAARIGWITESDWIKASAVAFE